jgi:hypothetical protein
MLRVRTGHNLGACLLALVIGLGLTVGSNAHGFREDEVECEETFAHLLECCTRSQLQLVECEYHEGCGSETFPSLTPYESRCLRELSCAEIRSADVCAQLEAREQTTNEPAAPLTVCP